MKPPILLSVLGLNKTNKEEALPPKEAPLLIAMFCDNSYECQCIYTYTILISFEKNILDEPI